MPNFDYEIITKESELDDLCLELSKCPVGDPMNPNVLDIETFPTEQTPMMPIGHGKFETPANDRFTIDLAGIALSWAEDKAAYIPLRHLDGNNLQFDRIVDSTETELLRKLYPFFNQWEWTNHVERFDWGVMKRRGVHVNYKYCSYIEAMCTGAYFDLFRGEEGGSDAGLKSIVLMEFGYQMRNMDELAKFHDGYHIERVAAETAAAYACDDANWARKLHRFLYPKVKDQFIFNVEMSISHLVEIMEENGLPFKAEPCKTQLDRLQRFGPVSVEAVLAYVERQLGKRVTFDVSNANHVREILFQTAPGVKRKMPPEWCLNLPIQKTSRKTGQASTDAKTLDKMAKDFEIIHNILTVRKLDKAEDSFLSTLPGYIHPLTNKIHSTYHQGGVPAGRFASSAPNAQNISNEKEYVIRDSSGMLQSWVNSTQGEFAKEFIRPLDSASKSFEVGVSVNIRDCIEVEEDELLVAADYRQAEFWGACELAKELGMLKMIGEGHDPHTATSSLMWSVPIDQVTNDLRKKGKTRNFAMLFGETDEGAAYKEGIPVDEIRQLRLRHERAIPRIISDRNSVISFARKNGCVYTHFGRKVDLSQLYEHPDRKVHEKADRLAYNARIQGSFTGDLPKIAMARCMKLMRNEYPNYPNSHNAVHIPLIHNGHDALMFRLTPRVRGDLRTLDLPRFVEQLRTAMEIHISGFVLSAKIDISVGHKYGSMVDIHKTKKLYAGQSYEEMVNMVVESDNKEATRVKEIDAAKTNGIHLVNGHSYTNGNGSRNGSNGHSNGNGHCSNIKLQLAVAPTSEQAVALKAMLLQYPGHNIVTLNYSTTVGPQTVTINRFPTSLNLNDAEKFGLILPCKVLAEKAEEHFAFMAAAMNKI